ncbi:secreted protein [Dactylonectria estremocensis]|uniref:Secreted protein n=1 Tax=Dactylonectria estremocensis TaxID=1079267 RepID=A0A9P9E9H2_9HYPO|nr:secreted protein [Dactylonectria estremocensis]
MILNVGRHGGWNDLTFLLALVAGSVMPLSVCADAAPPVNEETGVSAYAFDMSQVSLSSSRWQDNQDRTLTYIKWVDVDRLLYNFRAAHGLSTNDAEPNGGWDAPDFPFRTHFQGHFLNAWAYCYAVLQDDECRDRAVYFVEELAKCQANNDAVGFKTGYLSGFPESEIDKLENRTLSNGNVPYYAIHKTMAGLLDVWRHIGDTTARDVLLGLSAWVDGRTSALSYAQMQTMMSTEFGGMNEVLADVFHQTGDERWLEVAQRFDHATIFDPLASNIDSLNGLHANTQVPKWIGAAREFKATGTSRYKAIASNAWNITVNAHSYAIGGNSQSEHFRAPDAIASYLKEDTCEACNTYNMLKLTRELWLTNPTETSYFDFYERALLNHLLGQQNPDSDHGHITYFTPLNPGGRRGVGPAWGGGTWSTDYDSFWCCQGTALETNTKLADSIYFYDSSSLYVNLFTPSVLKWTQRGITVTQSTEYPVGDTTTLKIAGGNGGRWTLRVRIPGWTSGVTIKVNGKRVSNVSITPGTYAAVTRSWRSTDTVTVTLPMKLHTVVANDNDGIAALAYGPVILSGDYGDETLAATPTLELDSVQQVNGLEFEGTADGETVSLVPFYDAHDVNYNVYWKTSGTLA